MTTDSARREEDQICRGGKEQPEREGEKVKGGGKKREEEKSDLWVLKDE